MDAFLRPPLSNSFQYEKRLFAVGRRHGKIRTAEDAADGKACLYGSPLNARQREAVLHRDVVETLVKAVRAADEHRQIHPVAAGPRRVVVAPDEQRAIVLKAEAVVGVYMLITVRRVDVEYEHARPGSI